MILRPFRSGDAEALADLYRRSVLHYGPSAYSAAQVEAWASTASAARIGANCTDGRLVLVAVDAADRHLGWGDLEADGHLDFLYVAPEAQGLRVGSALYAALEDHARSAAMPRIYVEASELARRLFEKRGFRVQHRNDLRIGDVDIHNFSMEKHLSPETA